MRASARVGTRAQAGANDNARKRAWRDNGRLLYPRNVTQIASLGAEDCHIKHIVCLGCVAGEETIFLNEINGL